MGRALGLPSGLSGRLMKHRHGLSEDWITSLVSPKWLTAYQLGIKYGLGRKSLRAWINGQGKDCYRLITIQTSRGIRILDPQLEFPPRRLAGPDAMFIFRASDVATLLGISKRWVNRLANSGKINWRLYGKTRFFPVSEVRRLFLERSCAKALLSADCPPNPGV